MTRILVWNVQKFGVNKIRNPTAGNEKGTSITRAQASRDRRNYILSHLALRHVPGGPLVRPEIIVILEITSRAGNIGTIARGAGSYGSRVLLQKIRQRTANPNWMLVPPVRSGTREAVSIFFDSTNLAFTGPWRWSGGNGPSGAAVATGPYPGAYNGMLPARFVPPGDPNTGILESRVAPAWQSTYCAASPNAGLAVPLQPRIAYHARFVELQPAVPPIRRRISLFAIHSPASFAARQYFYDLADVAEIVDNIAGDEVRVVLGDFNYNLLRADGPMTLAGAYTQMALLGYAAALARPGAAPAPVNGYKGYFTTITKPPSNSQYWSTNTTARYYPVYGYADRLTRNLYSIDNLLAAYGGGANAGGPLANATVINGVVGSPFTAHPAPGNAPVGHYHFSIKMADAVPFGAPPLIAPAFTLALRTAFINWRNYRKIRSTSDHLALVADV